MQIESMNNGSIPSLRKNNATAISHLRIPSPSLDLDLARTTSCYIADHFRLIAGFYIDLSNRFRFIERSISR